MSDLKKLAAIAQAEGLSPILHENHRRPVTRRDLVAQGFLSGTAMVVAPSLLSMISGRAYAEPDCGPGLGGEDSPANAFRVFAFEGAGGMNLTGSNFMVWPAGGKKSGKLIATGGLNTLGLPTAEADLAQLNDDFGITMHNNSALYHGMLAATTAECRAKVNGFPICVSSADDTANNPFSLAYWANKAGANGTLSSIIGTEVTAHGARSMAPPESVVNTVSSTQIRGFADARSLVSAARLEQMAPGRLGAILRASKGMSESRLGMFAAKELPDQVRDLIRCGYIKAESAVSSGLIDAVDASKDTALTTALAGVTYTNTRNFALNRAITGNGNILERTVASAFLLLKGYAAFATEVIGGCDYHNNPRATTNQRDFDIGFRIGTTLQMAHIMGKSMVCLLYTDGGVGCSDANTPDDQNNPATSPAGGRGRFTADRGEGGALIVLAIGATGRPQVINDAHQVGSFNSNGAVDQTDPDGKVVSNSPPNAIQCALMNILALHNRLEDLDKVLGAANPFSDASVRDKYLMFGPWPA